MAIGLTKEPHPPLTRSGTMIVHETHTRSRASLPRS